MYGVTSKINPSLFIWCNTKQEVVGLMAINVDDFLCTGDNDFTESLISKLQDNFVLGKIFGTEYKTEGNIITFVQKSYVDNLTKINIDINQRKKTTPPLTIPKKEILQSKVGQLLWLCNQTCPDISFQISNLASKLKRSSINELIQCNKIISEVIDINLKLQYQKLQASLKLVVYTETSFGYLTDGRQCVYLIFL